MPLHTISCDDAVSFCVEAVWGFAELDVEGKFVWINPAFSQILNAPADLVIGTTFQSWTHPDDLTIDVELSQRVKLGVIPSYTLAKRYIQRGSTPQNLRLIWGMLSVSGKWSPTKEFLGYRAQFRPYDEPPRKLRIDIKKAIEWTATNWKTIVIVTVVLTSLISGGSERLLNVLQKAKETQQSVESVLSPSLPGASPAPHSP